jgi:fermentation-respiration switch protein FrsA (DUF1100 family)
MNSADRHLFDKGRPYNVRMEARQSRSVASGRSRLWGWYALRYSVFGLIVFVGANVVLLALENWLLFHPTAASASWEPPPSTRMEDLELHLADGTLIHSWWYPTKDWKPEDGATLYFHGNAGNLSHRGGVADRWQREMGQAVLMVDYPGFGRSEGTPSETGCFAAADAGYEWLTREKRVPADQIFIYGGSLGGAVAVDLASRHRHRALILVDTFASMPEMAHYVIPYFPVTGLVHNRFDSASKIANCMSPIFQIHRTGDPVVPYEQGKRLFNAARARRHFVKMEGTDHDEALPDGMYERFRSFLKEAESPAGAAFSVSGVPD